MALQSIPPTGSKFWVRFDAKVWRGEETECAIWTGKRNKWGYGTVKLRGEYVFAHRVAFLRAGGVLTPEKPCVLHRCDNPSCCEPSHLWAGTRAENQIDKAQKNRGNRSRCGLPFGVKPAHGCRGFEARLTTAGVKRYLGTYRTAEEAARVAREAKEAWLSGRLAESSALGRG